MFCLNAFLLESTPLHAKEWTAEQKEIVNWFKKYVEICFGGGADKVMSFFHPKYSEWDYRQELPIGFDEKKKKAKRVQNLDLGPLS